MFTVVMKSIRDDTPLPFGHEFATVQALRGAVTRELRGLSAYWRVEVLDADGTVVGSGTRVGKNGTGNRWTWDGAAAVPKRDR